MHNNHILSLDDAAKHVHATPDTLLQYIRRGELPAARVGKRIVITLLDLVTFVQELARQQSMERQAKHTRTAQQENQDAGYGTRYMKPPFVQLSEALTQPVTPKRKGRRTQLPQLGPEKP